MFCYYFKLICTSRSVHACKHACTLREVQINKENTYADKRYVAIPTCCKMAFGGGSSFLRGHFSSSNFAAQVIVFPFHPLSNNCEDGHRRVIVRLLHPHVGLGHLRWPMRAHYARRVRGSPEETHVRGKRTHRRCVRTTR